jgi:tRNA-splicing ligase RtcB
MAHLEKLKTMIPMEQIEQGAQQQIYANLELDFLKILAIMPDVHKGYLLPIGGVALLDGVISPEYVGFDEGCGMCCIVTDKLASDFNKRQLLKIFNKIYDTVPVGVGVPRKHGYYDIPQFVTASGDKNLQKKVVDKQYVQIGTLGAGNHFIEIGVNREGKIVITIHSGSRNPGHSIASYYMLMANQEDKHLPNGFLDLNGDLGKAFTEDLGWALQYALDNRMLMMTDVMTILGFSDKDQEIYLRRMINENHNHAIIRPDGVLHRKGATPAELGVLGVIPGTMKSGVYITRGLGNDEYLNSASHGAGRKMGRKAAKRAIELSQHIKWMKGIIAKVDKSTLDEAHGAYKNLATVVSVQEGVVLEVVDYVKPLINVKG